MLMLPYGKKGLLTVRNCPIKHGPETLNLIEVVKLPEQVAVMHYAKITRRICLLSPREIEGQIKRQRRQH